MTKSKVIMMLTLTQMKGSAISEIATSSLQKKSCFAVGVCCFWAASESHVSSDCRTHTIQVWAHFIKNKINAI